MMDPLDLHRYATRGFHEFGVLAHPNWLEEANAYVKHLERDAATKGVPPYFCYREGYIPELDTLIFYYMENLVQFGASVSPWLHYLLGPRWHIDHFSLHSQSDHRPPGPTGLHGPGYPHDRRQHHTVRNGQIHETMVVVSLSLVDVNPGDGGLAVVPGSHHNSLPFNREWASLDEWPNNPYPVEQVCVAAGGVVLFTEALVHGTLPWRGKGTRPTVLAKCCAEKIRWADDRRALLVEG